MASSFPKICLNPSTPHSLPNSRWIGLVRKLRERGINAFGFLMSDHLEKKLKIENFHNDESRALEDLKNQLPDPLREEFSTELKFVARD